MPYFVSGKAVALGDSPHECALLKGQITQHVFGISRHHHALNPTMRKNECCEDSNIQHRIN
jgi:hypothetical protein